MFFGIVSREDAVFEAVLLSNDVGGISVMDNILGEKLVVLENVLDHSAKKSDVGPGTE